MSNSRSILFVVHFEGNKGGIARVGRLMYESLQPYRVISLFGQTEDFEEKEALGCQGSVLKFLAYMFYFGLFHGVRNWYFDHLGKASIILLLPAYLRRKLVVFLHDEEAWTKVRGRNLWVLRQANRLICNSQFTYDRFITRNFAFIEKTRVCLLAGVPPLFETTSTDPVTTASHADWLSGDQRFCLFVSRLWSKHRYKGYLELVDAFALFKSQRPDTRLKLVIIGRGDDEPFLRNRIEELNLQDEVVHFNDVDDPTLVQFYQACEALVFPSSREGFGFVFLEAMVVGKACIGLENQPAEEIIQHEKTGLLLPDNSPHTLTTVLFDIELAPEKYQQYGAAGKKRYQERFTNEHFRHRFLAAI
ncbi:MAG: glycosyltransferase family 4 protein [Bacteroidota bacterium]